MFFSKWLRIKRLQVRGWWWRLEVRGWWVGDWWWRLEVRGWWVGDWWLRLVVGGWWLVVGGWWLAVGDRCKKKRTSGTGVTELSFSASVPNTTAFDAILWLGFNFLSSFLNAFTEKIQRMIPHGIILC
ncbi:MAG: hypothetical protein PT955_00450 [Bacteroidales bacterium]|nr:hypothetical protein [Bacteroidales bacterium]